MAVNAPSHRQIFNLADTFHGLHWPMTALALHLRVHMSPMIEVHKVGDVMDLDPVHRPGGPCALHLLIKTERLVKLAQFLGNYRSDRTFFFSSCLLFRSYGAK